MKIATWNIERLKHFASLQTICSICSNLDADVLVLTETDERVALDSPYRYMTDQLTEESGIRYRPTEHRVAIYTKYPLVQHHPTFDRATALCVEVETERGNLIVYATIMGVFGNRHPSYMKDLNKQILDISALPLNANICICGDFNCSFSDNYYFTKEARRCLVDTFEKRGIDILTAAQSECIDHIAISRSFVHDFDIQIMEWNIDKSLSDHKGISIQF